MMLGLSNTENETNFDTVTKGAEEVSSGVPAEAELSQFADAVIGRDADAIATARGALSEQLPPDGVVEAASVRGRIAGDRRIGHR